MLAEGLASLSLFLWPGGLTALFSCKLLCCITFQLRFSSYRSYSSARNASPCAENLLHRESDGLFSFLRGETATRFRPAVILVHHRELKQDAAESAGQRLGFCF